MIKLRRIDFASQTAVGGARWFMGNELPGLHGEFKALWCSVMPLLSCLKPGELVEGDLNLDEVEELKILLL